MIDPEKDDEHEGFFTILTQYIFMYVVIMCLAGMVVLFTGMFG